MNDRDFDVPLIVGSGVAGLSVALGLPRSVVITKTTLGEGSSRWAQGGVASAVGTNDDPRLHAEDTIRVGGGLADEVAVRSLTTGGPDAIVGLVESGANFDRNSDGTLKLGREAGHGVRRIVHADGDATGAEIMRALIARVMATPTIELFENVHVVDLVLSDGAVRGVVVMAVDGSTAIWTAPAVVLATGGIGQIYARTTNPIEVTGDGIAMAARAGVELVDMEFVQFHPTGLDVGVDPMPLLTEALRGDGAQLFDADGHRYMPDVHPDAELAPRDVVARANYERRGRAYLDATSIGPDFAERFPTVFGLAQAAGLDPRVDRLPVSATAHYFMGGIAATDTGRTSLPGLFAVGECASTGVHGANRLASNSLLEGLVFGRRVAEAVSMAQRSVAPIEIPSAPSGLCIDRGDAFEVLRHVMWEHVGVIRSADSLETARAMLAAIEDDLNRSLESRNALTVARVVIESARRRTESRGAHARSDFPETDPSQARRNRITLTPQLISPRVAA